MLDIRIQKESSGKRNLVQALIGRYAIVRAAMTPGMIQKARFLRHPITIPAIPHANMGQKEMAATKRYNGRLRVVVVFICEKGQYKVNNRL